MLLYASSAAILAFIAAMRPTDAPSGPPPRSSAGLPNHSMPSAAPATDEAPLLRDLLLAPHAPLRFVSAQLLWAAAPLAELLGVETLTRWAVGLEATTTRSPRPE